MSSPLNLAGPQTKPRILVVDDIPENLQGVGTMLRNEGYHVTLATSGLRALERAHSEPPDLILPDLMLAEMDGLEACRRLAFPGCSTAFPL